MNHRDRALAAMRGEPVDRIPFIARMERFILGFGDNVPTDALFDRVKRVVEFWQKY